MLRELFLRCNGLDENNCCVSNDIGISDIKFIISLAPFVKQTTQRFLLLS